MGRPVNRIDPMMSASSYKTYQIVAPKSTHFRKATCEEVDCPAFLKGWRTTLDATDEARLNYIRKNSGRKFKEYRNELGQVVFEFEAGQSCFAANDHATRIDKPELYVVRDGDWRGNPRGTTPRKHKNAQEWQEDFALHQDKINTEIERG
jgi:hypothetical protein